MPIAPELLEILVSPTTHQPLRLATAAELAEVNAQIDAGEATNTGGEPVRERLQEGLVPTDGDVIFPVRDQIPILLPQEAIPLARDGAVESGG